MRIIDMESVINLIEDKQRALCPVGLFSRHQVYGDDRRKFDDLQEIIDAIELLPEADAEPVRHGKWIEPVPGDGFPYCSNCKNIALDKGAVLNPKLMDWYLTPYCPHCGALMSGGNSDDD